MRGGIYRGNDAGIHSLAIPCNGKVQGLLRITAYKPIKPPLLKFDPVVLNYTANEQGQFEQVDEPPKMRLNSQRLFVELVMQKLMNSTFIRELEQYDKGTLLNRARHLGPTFRDFLTTQQVEHFLFGTTRYHVTSDEMGWDPQYTLTSGGGRRTGIYASGRSDDGPSWSNAVRTIER